MVIGQVLYGINNIYTVDIKGELKQCRIKGKVLKEENDVYNPIAVGDYVQVENDPISDKAGWICRREERRTTLLRWNRKKRTPQVIAANVDTVVCVSSIDSPPFRPRFIDRILVTCEYENIRPVIVVNKTDLEMPDGVRERIDDYRNLGYKVILSSVKTGDGIEELKETVAGGLAVFCGQSGVGKSSLLNCVEPGLQLRIGDLSAKYNRGSHTTCYSVLVTLSNGQKLIDTPGIRELYIHDMPLDQLRFYFTEFQPLAPKCAYPSCLHMDEPDCAVKKAVAKGRIHSDRYESYTRIYQSIIDMETGNYE